MMIDVCLIELVVTSPLGKRGLSSCLFPWWPSVSRGRRLSYQAWLIHGVKAMGSRALSPFGFRYISGHVEWIPVHRLYLPYTTFLTGLTVRSTVSPVSLQLGSEEGGSPTSMAPLISRSISGDEDVSLENVE